MSKSTRANHYIPLSPSIFYILLSLSIKERHGYDIMKQVKKESGGKVALGPGTLYGSIKKMLTDGLITESDERPDPALDDNRRRYYKITKLGSKMLSTELQRFEEALKTAKNNKIHIALTSIKLTVV